MVKDFGFRDEYEAATVEAMWEELFAEDAKPTVVNIPRLQQMEFAYAVVKYLSKDIPGSRVSYKLYEPFKSMGSVSIEAGELAFLKTEWFARAAEFASNTEVYPLANGRVRLTFTFWGIAKPIEEGE